jgi:hypothetical protein
MVRVILTLKQAPDVALEPDALIEEFTVLTVKTVGGQEVTGQVISVAIVETERP